MAAEAIDPHDPALLQRTRQGLYWRLMSALFEEGEAAPNLESLAGELAGAAGLPKELLDPRISVDALVARFPALKAEFARPLPGFEPSVASVDEGDAEVAEETGDEVEAPADLQGVVKRALVVSKLLLNAFGPNTQGKSMTAARVQTTILASIFAGLPNVIVHLFAFDTRVIDLTPWVNDPVETLLRTKLGGGNDMRLALDAAAPFIDSPQNTAVVVISDFYDWSDFFSLLRQWKEAGAHLIPVGSLHTTGYFSVNPEYSQKFKEIGAPILHGSPKKLIEQIKKVM